MYSNRKLKAIRWMSWTLGPALFLGCSSGFLKYDKSDDMKSMKEFDNQVKIEAPVEPDSADESTPTGGTSKGSVVNPPVTPAANPPKSPASKSALSKKSKKEPKSKKGKAAVEASIANPSVPKESAVPSQHEPELEGQEGFVGRRPLRDPFRVGEKVVHEVSYFKMKAGEMTLSVKPFATVNGRKNYHFQLGLKTSSVFESFYSVDDFVSSLVDFERMVPSVYTLHVKETNQLKEARFLMDWDKLQASYWEKKVTKKDGPEEKKDKWEIQLHTQDVFSGVFYMRVFPWKVGDSHAFRVADNGENLIFRAKALRREKISTAAGDFQTIVIKPEVELQGQFKPVGDIFFWLSDDDRHLILKIESKIKIGTIVSEVIRLEPGRVED